MSEATTPTRIRWRRYVATLLVLGVTLFLLSVWLRRREGDRFEEACKSLDPGTTIANARKTLTNDDHRVEGTMQVEGDPIVKHYWSGRSGYFRRVTCEVKADAGGLVVASRSTRETDFDGCEVYGGRIKGSFCKIASKVAP